MPLVSIPKVDLWVDGAAAVDKLFYHDDIHGGTVFFVFAGVV
jgi:hypothetical protein